MPENELNKIEVRSEEIQDILGQVPRWIVRWGTVVVLVTVLILLVFSWVFEYPEIKRADIRVTTENPPATLVARADGQIERLFVSDSQYVEAKKHLAVIESSASYSDVISLRFDIEEIRTTLADFEEGKNISFNNSYTLGEIQSFYAEFVNKYKDYYQFLELDSYAKTIRSKEDQIRQLETHIERLRSQSRILLQDYELSKRQYARIDTLLRNGAIAEAEADKSKSELLSKELNYEESLTEMSTIEIQISDLNQDILQYELTEQDENEQKQQDIREAFEKLIAQIDIWEQKYILETPIEGIVSFNSIYHENQNVRIGDNVFTIIPSDPGEIIGKIDLPVEGSGKVKIDHPVNIQFANFPHLEYGMVRGIIRSKSLVADDELYTVEVDLPDGLITYYGKEIPFNQEMLGRAHIITDDRRLIQRIFSPIKSMLSEQKAGRED